MKQKQPWEIQIDRNVPLPKRSVLSGVGRVLSQMEVGDSFEVEEDASVRSNVYNAAKKVGIKVCLRKTPGGKMRIWRSL